MNILIVSEAYHFKEYGKLLSYAPYVREMNLWLQYVSGVTIVAPEINEACGLSSSYNHNNLTLIPVPAFSIRSVSELVRTLFKAPKIIYIIYKEMRCADHIHLRCPSNMGLLGAIVQIAFPKTPKTVKYAGNWDPNAKQPWSYNLQKWILSNTVLTKNCKVLVYGEWPGQTENILPFFTATYSEAEIEPLKTRDYDNSLKLIFVGTLSEGKQPLKAIKLTQKLIKAGKEASLSIFGDGALKPKLEAYISEHNLDTTITLYGNVPSQHIKTEMQSAHFLILPSKSEGWPKAVAEAMFWGCIPITTPVSCVPWMLGYGKRGVLLDVHFSWDNLLADTEKLETMSTEASKWSRQYTLEKFEKEIKKLLTQDS